MYCPLEAKHHACQNGLAKQGMFKIPAFAGMKNNKL